MLPCIRADIKYIEADKRKQTIEFEGTKIYFLSYADLIQDKIASGRKKDLEDIKHLKKLRE